MHDAKVREITMHDVQNTPINSIRVKISGSEAISVSTNSCLLN